MPARLLIRRLGGLLLAACVATAVAGLAPASAAGRATSGAAPASTPPAGGPAWSSLTPPQRTVLEPLASEWNAIDPVRKQKWLEIATRFPTMTAEERERVHVRMIEWVHMTPQQRTQARINFQQSRDVSKEERQARWQAYQALPEERKRELARRAAPASAASAAIAGQPRVPTPLDEVRPKSNLVRAAGTSPANGGTASAMAVQARPGATTTLLTTPTHPPSHQQTGQPKIAGGPGDVDDATLLPKRGPQGAPLQLPRKPTASPPKPPAAPVVLPASGANPPAASPSAPAPLPAATASRP